jgi:hypothetical protein
VIVFDQDPKANNEAEWNDRRRDPRLSALLYVLEVGWYRANAGPVKITSVFRPYVPGERPSVHNDWRGADVSTKDVPLSVVRQAEAEINRLFDYGLGHPAALYHESKPGAGDWHLHLQVPPVAGIAGFKGLDLRRIRTSLA